MGIDEAWHDTEAAAVDHVVDAARRVCRLDLGVRPDRGNPLAVDKQRGVADHTVLAVDRQRERNVADERPAHALAASPPIFRPFASQ